LAPGPHAPKTQSVSASCDGSWTNQQAVNVAMATWVPGADPGSSKIASGGRLGSDHDDGSFSEDSVEEAQRLLSGARSRTVAALQRLKDGRPPPVTVGEDPVGVTVGSSRFSNLDHADELYDGNSEFSGYASDAIDACQAEAEARRQRAQRARPASFDSGCVGEPTYTFHMHRFEPLQSHAPAAAQKLVIPVELGAPPMMRPMSAAATRRRIAVKERDMTMRMAREAETGGGRRPTSGARHRLLSARPPASPRAAPSFPPWHTRTPSRAFRFDR